MIQDATAITSKRRWHRLGSFSPYGLARHLSGVVTHGVRRVWLGATIYRQGPPRDIPTLDFGALRKIVPMVAVDDPDALRMARDALQGRAEILGYGVLDFTYKGPAEGRQIGWNLDPTSGATWPLESPRVSTPGPRGLPGEIKIPWELSRGHHWVALATAYALSRDRSYLGALTEQWQDWLKANPAQQGVNWLLPMEAAIRAVNWLWTLSILERAEVVDCANDEVRRSLLEHGIFIDTQLEYSGRPSDHYLSDIVGLLYLGVAFRSSPLGQRWLRLAHSRFLSRFRVDVGSDGGFPVGSTGYHRFVADLFRHGASVCQAAGLPLPADWPAVANRQMDLLVDLSRPDGTLVAFGDSDDAQVVPASNVRAGSRDRQGSGLPGRRSIAYPESGFYVMRSGDHGCAIDAFSERKDLPFGYRHNGRLGLEIWVAGKSLVVDPGTFCYTRSPRKRQYFRSTRAHSVAQIDRLEHNRTRREDLAWLGGEARVNVLGWEIGGSADHFEAALDGLGALSGHATRHVRTVNFDKKALAWSIKDRFLGDGQHRMDFRLVLAPGVACSLTAPGEVTCTIAGTGVSVRLTATFLFKIRLEKTFVSPQYGAKYLACRIRVSGHGNLPAEIVCTIVPQGTVEVDVRGPA